MVRVRSFSVLLFGVVTALLLGSGLASAHASLISTSPTTGTHVDKAPSELVLQLNEPVTLIEGSAQLIDGDGGVAELAEVRVDDGQRRIVLLPAEEIADGAYLATARVVSADTHVVSLSIQFTVGSVTAQGSFATDSGRGVEQYLNYPSKTLAYLGLVFSSGLLLASLWVWRSAPGLVRFRWVYRIGAGALAAGLAGRLFVLVAQQSGGVDRISFGSVRTVSTAPNGVAIAVAVVVSVVAIVVPPGRGRGSGALGVVQAAVAVVAVTLGGHGGSAGGWPWSFLATVLHVYGITVWLGGLAVMLLVLRAAPQLRRWHVVAVVHVGLAVVAGLVLSLLQIRPIGALWGTAYGLVLLAKVFVVVVVVGLGYLAFRHFRRRTLLVESVAAVSVLALTSVLSTLAPAKDVYTTDIATTLDFGSSEVLDIGIDSIRRGPQQLTISYPSTDGSVSVSVDLSSSAANVARLPVALTGATDEGGDLVWRSDGLIVPAPGEWKVTVRFDGSHGPKVASFYYDAL
ncbi:copper resistance CopC/CopD family protein [Rhodococcoides kyotonense]|uniref:copper resistance CopC/CopD family protein n=1 Tax=Rhodococcoides kyotonense TaxID=398843 RepID=UPI000B792D15|nr:copper resistance protein CopC [Rhodococcus kyotonensis]